MSASDIGRAPKRSIQKCWQIETAGPDQIDDCRSVYNIARKSAGIFGHVDDLTIDQFEAVTKDEVILVAIRSDGVIGGFSRIYLPDDFLHHLYVAPIFQREGLGCFLLHASSKLAAQPLRMKCVVSNKIARAFYRSNGWWEGEFGGPSPEGDWLWLHAP